MKLTIGLSVVVAANAANLRDGAEAGTLSLYKNVKAFLGTAAAAEEPGRDLQEMEKSTLRCFTECIEQQMDAVQCEEHIKSILGEDLSGHVVPNLQIKIHNPRPVPNSPIAQERVYYEIGIPTNLRGEVACDINGGEISVPWEWAISATKTVPIPTVGCMGLDATECCDKFFEAVDAAGVPRVNHFGHCLSCWVDQELLEPIVLSGSGEIGYQDYTALGGSCTTYELEQMDVQTQDAQTKTALTSLAGDISTFLEDGASCADLSAFQVAARFHARGLPHAMKTIANLLCGYCEDPTMTYTTIPVKLSRHLTRIYDIFTTESPKSDENCIVIYTNKEGQVIEPPKIGGNRANIDNNLDDPECEELEGPEVEGPGPGPEGEGPEVEGPGTGPEGEGPETEGPETEGPETEGPETEGPETEGPETEGPETEGPGTGTGNSGKSEKSEKSEKSMKSKKSDKSNKSGTGANPTDGTPGGSAKSMKSKKSDKSKKSAKSEKGTTPDKVNEPSAKSMKSEKSDKSKKGAKSEKGTTPDKVNEPSAKSMKSEKSDKSKKGAKSEKGTTPDKVNEPSAKPMKSEKSDKSKKGAKSEKGTTPGKVDEPSAKPMKSEKSAKSDESKKKTNPKESKKDKSRM